MGKDISESSKQIAKGALLVMISLLIGKITSYIYTILVARISSEILGLYSLGVSIISFLVIISLFGLKSGIVRYISFYKAKGNEAKIKGTINSALKICIPLSILFLLTLAIFSNQISQNIFHNAQLSNVIFILAFGIPLLTIIEVIYSIFIAFKKIEFQILISTIEKIIKVIIILILLYIGFKLEAVIFSYMVSILVSFILSIMLIKSKIFKNFKKKIKRIEIKKELLLYSFPLLFSGVLVSIVKWTDTVMVGLFKNISDVGIYNVALSTSNLMVIIPTALMSLFLPLITENYSKKNHKEISHIFKKTTKWIFTLNIIPFIFILFFSKEILKLMFGNEYIISGSSLIILTIGYFIFSFVHIHSNYLIMIKKTRLILLINTIMSASNVILNLYLIPKYGIIGGAIATSTALLISYTISSIFSYKFNKINPYDSSFIKPIIASLISLVLIIIIKAFIISNIIIIGVIFCVSYGALILLIKGIDEEDKELISLVTNKIKNFKK